MPLGNFALNGKIALVTGAGSGINLSFAKLCVENNGRVILADLRLTAEAEDFVSKSGGKSTVFAKCDVTKRGDLENLVKVSLEAFGDVPDVWIAGAGVFEPVWSNFWDDTEDDDYKEMQINAVHPIKLTRIAVRTLLGRKKKGVVLVVASLAGYQGTFAAPLYCASKHACVGFVRSMEELDRLKDIKVVLIAPGNVTTPLWSDHPEKMKQFGTTSENSITPEAVAVGMKDLVEESRYPGGSCMEISSAGTRLLGTWNIAAPAAQGTSVSPAILERNYRPIMATMAKESGTAAGAAASRL